jgi:hypothetical protein
MAILSFRINDLAWSLRTRDPVLLLATDSGLFEQDVQTGGSPVQVLVDAQNQDLGFYAVSVTRDVNGLINVAVAGQGTAGVYLSSQGGGSATFRLTGLKNEDIRSLGVQVRGARSFLWAGTAAAGTEDPGKGCFRWELRGNDDPPDKWRPFNKGYTGGSARSLAFLEDLILVASHRKGVLQLDTSKVDAAWQEPAADCGLPPRDLGRFQPVEAVAVDPNGQLIMAGTALGVYRSMDKGKKYQSVSSLVFADKVTLPPTWLFCSDKHKVSVVREEEAG